MKKMLSFIPSLFFMSVSCYGAEEVEFDFDNPTQEQREEQRILLMGAGVSPNDVLDIDVENPTPEQIAQQEALMEKAEYDQSILLSCSQHEEQFSELAKADIMDPSYFQMLIGHCLDSERDKATILAYKKMMEHLKSIPDGSDVHVLDPYILATPQNMMDLFEMGSLVSMDYDSLSWSEIKDSFLLLLPLKLYVEYKIENPAPQPVTMHIVTYNEPETATTHSMEALLNLYLDNIANELTAMALKFPGNPQLPILTRQLYSRVATLLHQIKVKGDEQVVKLLAYSVAENKITGGGCLEGRIDRMFILYASLLGACGGQKLTEVVS